MEVSKLACSQMTLLLLSSLFCVVSCGEEETCESVFVHRLDPERGCYGEAEEAPELEACRTELQRGTAFECVRSPEGALYVAGLNAAASLQSASWTLEKQLDAAEKATCDQLRSLGFPEPRLTCPAG